MNKKNIVMVTTNVSSERERRLKSGTGTGGRWGAIRVGSVLI